MENLHPLFVHFPIALFLLVPLIDLISIIRREGWYHRASLLVLFLGVLSAAAAATTGLMAADTVPHPSDVVRSLLETHETFALTTLGVAVAILLWRLAVLRKQTRGMLVAILAAEIVLLGGLVAATGYFGGELVFGHGVGTALTAEQPVGQGHAHEAEHGR